MGHDNAKYEIFTKVRKYENTKYELYESAIESLEEGVYECTNDE